MVGTIICISQLKGVNVLCTKSVLFYIYQYDTSTKGIQQVYIMKITKTQLRALIREELQSINEAIVKPSKVQSEVNKIKKRLIKKAESGKFYENFGQKEVDKLEDKYIDISSYTVEMNKIRDILTDFRKWARNYSPN
jgi:ATP-dependent Lon protease